MDKWSGSIEMGITTHNPSVLDFPATMTNMRSGITNGEKSWIVTVKVCNALTPAQITCTYIAKASPSSLGGSMVDMLC